MHFTSVPSASLAQAQSRLREACVASRFPFDHSDFTWMAVAAREEFSTVGLRCFLGLLGGCGFDFLFELPKKSWEVPALSSEQIRRDPATERRSRGQVSCS